MEKFHHMQDDKDLWSLAMAIEMGEMRAKNLVEDSFEDGKKAGIIEGIEKGRKEGHKKGLSEGQKAGQRQATIDLLHQLIQTKFETDAFAWLTSLDDAQLQQIAPLILSCQTLEKIKQQIQ